MLILVASSSITVLASRVPPLLVIMHTWWIGYTCLGATGARGDHAGLEQRALEEHLVVVQRLVDGGEDTLRGGGAGPDVVDAAGEDLGLQDGDQPVLLADRRVPGEPLRVLPDGELRRRAGGGVDLEHGAPLGEPGAALVVPGAARAQAVEALRGGLAARAGDLDEPRVRLDARHHAAAGEQVHERPAVGGLLVQGLLVKDDAGEVGGRAGRREEQLPQRVPVGRRVLDVGHGQALADGARRRRLVGGEDAPARRRDVLGSLDQLICRRASYRYLIVIKT